MTGMNEIEKTIKHLTMLRRLDSGEKKHLYDLAISALEAQQVDMWIPITWLCEETYPEPFKEVIFTDGDYIYIGCCDSDGKWTSTNQENSINVYDVKAWKPLPEPYKEEAYA